MNDAPESAVDFDSNSGTENEILQENADYISAQNCPNWEQIRANLKTAMLDYPRYKGAKKPHGKCALENSRFYLCTGFLQPSAQVDQAIFVTLTYYM